MTGADWQQRQNQLEQESWLADRAAQAEFKTWLIDYDTTKEPNMNVNELLPSKYLKQSDVPDEMLVTVAGIKKVNVARDDDEPEYKFVIKFHEFEKAMVLNATNIKRLGKALGPDTDDWVSGTVYLYVDPDIEFGGNIVGGLRIRSAGKKSTVAPIQRDPDDKLSDVPF